MLGVKQVWALKNAVTSMYKTYPKIGNAITGGITFSLGDVLAQKLEMRRTCKECRYDLWRSMEVGLWGVVMNGLFLHHWFRLLDKVVGSSMTSKIGVALKIAADQFIYAPFAILSFFYFSSIRRTHDVAQTNKEILVTCQENFVPTFVADCVLWPSANFVNFRYINLAFRPSFTAVVQLLWQTYMSLMSGQSREATAPMLASSVQCPVEGVVTM